MATAKLHTPYEVEKMAQNLMDSKKFVGVSVMVITPDENFIVHLGETKRGSGIRPGDDSIYEIGSVTKALAGTMAAQMVSEGKLNVSQSVQRYLQGKQVSKSKETITSLDLMTQSSGIIPIFSEEAFKPKDMLNPWSGFSSQQLFSVLKKSNLNFPPGSKYEYSNLGAAVMGQVIEAVDKKPFAQVLQSRITGPLQLNDTVIDLSSEQSQRLVQGYYNNGSAFDAVPKWDMTGIPAIGAVLSTPREMVTLVKGLMDSDTALGKAFQVASTGVRPAVPGSSVGYFWHTIDDRKFVWHNGSTYGMSSLVAIHKEKKTAVVILANTVTEKHEETALGFALLTQAVAE